jgi:hypothetical protein
MSVKDVYKPKHVILMLQIILSKPDLPSERKACGMRTAKGSEANMEYLFENRRR